MNAQQQGREVGALDPPWVRVAPVATLVSVLIIAALVRLADLGFPSATLLRPASYDEAVYLVAARSLHHGIVPYADYFFAHPPFGLVLYAPAMIEDGEPWGGPMSMGAARLLAMTYGLAAVALVFALGHRLGGLVGASLASIGWAFDPLVVELGGFVLLDAPMIVLSYGALLIYLRAGRGAVTGPYDRRQLGLLALAGAVGALSALTKAVGATVILAMVADLTVALLFRRMGARRWLAGIASVLSGAALASAVVLGPVLVLDSGAAVRQILFFQLLRPTSEVPLGDRLDTLVRLPENALTLTLVAAGVFVLGAVLIVLAFRRLVHTPVQAAQWISFPGRAWGLVLLWVAFNIVVYLTTRRFFSQYYLHLAAALVLTAAATGLGPLLAVAGVHRRRVEAVLAMALVGLVAVTMLPDRVAHWRSPTIPAFAALAEELAARIRPGTPVLVLDARVVFIGGFVPVAGSHGRFVDPYGQLVYAGMEIDGLAFDELVADTFGGRGRTWEGVIASAAARREVSALRRSSNVVVFHAGELWRIAPEEVAAIRRSAVTEWIYADYHIWWLRPSSSAR